MTLNLWRLVHTTPSIDAKSLAHAVEDAVDEAGDFRTRLLIRESVAAIEHLWGAQAANEWLDQSAVGFRLREICQQSAREADPDEHGFPSLKRRIVNAIDPDMVLQYLRDLSRRVRTPTKLVIGGSIALILQGHLSRRTDDINLVDELPSNIRSDHELLHELDHRYGLQLTHFQSHYLPQGWQHRIHSIASFGDLQVYAVDLYDVFMTKLFSSRNKDRDDLRALLSHIDREVRANRFKTTTADLRGEAKLLDAAKTNWYVLFGEDLPA